MKERALDILLRQRRFDLIFKYLYVVNPSPYNREAYLENIRAFNGFHEEKPSDGVPKESPADFISSFNILKCSLQQYGYQETISTIPIGANGEITDGAHRLAICSALGIDIEPISIDKSEDWGYQFFIEQGMCRETMDYGALEYVKINPNAHIVNLQPITSTEKDSAVEGILNKYGFIFYKKKIWLTYNGLVNLKRIQYGGPWEKAEWIGTPENRYAGAQHHARHSMGNFPLRIYIFVCPDLNKVKQAKAEIRELFKIGNYSIHINDTHEEAIHLAETCFNSNSLILLNTKPYHLSDQDFNNTIEKFKNKCKEYETSLDDVVAVGSTTMNAYGIRHSNDFDYLCSNEIFKLHEENLSPHDSSLHFYTISKDELINNPNLYLYYHGVKFISLKVLLDMKKRRNEKKDRKDCSKIAKILQYQKNCFRIRKYYNYYRRRKLLFLQSEYTAFLYETFRHNWVHVLLKKTAQYTKLYKPARKINEALRHHSNL